MVNMKLVGHGALAALLAIATGGCAVRVASMDARADATQAGAEFSDPFAYCAAIGTMDAPDERYVGGPRPRPSSTS